MDDTKFPCPCCGYLVFQDPPGSYELCPICSWQDDALQLQFPTTLGGGANHITLAEAQRNFQTFGAMKPYLTSFVRPATPVDRRDDHWRPVDENRDQFQAFSPDHFQDIEEQRGEGLYYWRRTSMKA